MSFDEKSLALVLRAAQTGALGKAGRDVGLSPTAASQRLQALERDLGARLFHRTTRSIALTPEGERFIDHAREILDQLEQARTALAGDVGAVRGELRVTVSAAYGRRYVAPQIAAFLFRHPDLSVKLEMTDAMVDIVEAGHDLAIRIGALPDSSLVAQRLAPSPRVIIVSPRHLETCAPPRTPADLERLHCLTQGGKRSWRFRGPDGREEDVRVSGRFDTNHGDTLAAAAIGGLGFAQKSLWDVRRALADGRLTTVLDDYAVLPEASVWAVRPPGRSAPPRVKAFIDFFRAAIGAEPSW